MKLVTYKHFPLLRGLLAGALALGLACSSDPANTLGSDNDLIGSEPGTVFQDTLGVHEDTTYVFNTAIAGDTTLQFGRLQNYTRAMVLQPGFSAVTEADKQRVVESVSLRLQPASVTGNFPARFYELNRTYAEGDTIGVLDTLDAIVDPVSGSVQRSLQNFPVLYPLPPALVQSWIRDEAPRHAIAVLYTDDINDRVATFRSQDAVSSRPTLQVTFVGGIQKSFPISHDCSFIRPTTTTVNEVVSDGYARRVYFRVQTDDLAEDATVHKATVRFHLVPGTLLGSNTSVLIYSPGSTDPTTAKFGEGQAITEREILVSDDFLEFPITNALFLTLQGELADNGFVIRFKFPNTELREIQLYGSSAPDSLRPRVFVTTSTPADFDP